MELMNIIIQIKVNNIVSNTNHKQITFCPDYKTWLTL